MVVKNICVYNPLKSKKFSMQNRINNLKKKPLGKKPLGKKCKHGKSLDKKCIQCKLSDKDCIHGKSLDKKCIECKLLHKKCKHGKSLNKKCIQCKSFLESKSLIKSKNLLLKYKYSIKKDKNIRFNILLKAIKKETYANVLKNLKDLKKNNLKNSKNNCKNDSKKYDYDINKIKKLKKGNSTHILHGGNKQKMDIINKLIKDILNIEKKLKVKNNHK